MSHCCSGMGNTAFELCLQFFFMVVERCCGHIIAFFYFLFRSSFLYEDGLNFGDFSKIRKNPKITFLGIITTKLSSYWFLSSLFILVSWIFIFWYQNYVSLMLHWNFTSQNRLKIWPKMRPKVVIYDFSYHSTFIMLHSCF